MCEKHYRQQWRALNKEHQREYSFEYHKNITKPKKQATYQYKSKEKICKRCNCNFTASGTNQKFCSKTCQNNIAHKRKRLNTEFKLIHNLRSRLRKALSGKSRDKGFLVLLGCSALELKIHLESKFTTGMTWDNYGEWHINHIKPLSKFNLSNKEELQEACKYANLQPLWAKDNLAKGSN